MFEEGTSVSLILALPSHTKSKDAWQVLRLACVSGSTVVQPRTSRAPMVLSRLDRAKDIEPQA